MQASLGHEVVAWIVLDSTSTLNFSEHAHVHGEPLRHSLCAHSRIIRNIVLECYTCRETAAELISRCHRVDSGSIDSVWGFRKYAKAMRTRLQLCERHQLSSK